MPREPQISRSTLPDGTSVRVLHWPGADDAETCIVVHHGLGEHAGRYQAYADHLPAEVPLLAYDVRGHGETEGAKGVVRGLDQLADDLHAMLADLRRRAGSERVILFGHSMGAATVGHYLTTHEVHDFVSGVWLSAIPTVVEMGLVRYLQRGAARLLQNVVPDFTMPTNLQQDGISSVPAEIARYADDPLVHDQASIALGRSLFDDPPRILERGHLLTRPILMWHGAEDPIASSRGTVALFQKVAAEDKAMNIFEGSKHEVHHERPAIVSELMGWLSDWLDKHGAVAN